jgi:hypothetical protein
MDGSALPRNLSRGEIWPIMQRRSRERLVCRAWTTLFPMISAQVHFFFCRHGVLLLFERALEVTDELNCLSVGRLGIAHFELSRANCPCEVKLLTSQLSITLHLAGRSGECGLFPPSFAAFPFWTMYGQLISENIRQTRSIKWQILMLDGQLHLVKASRFSARFFCHITTLQGNFLC